MAINDVMGLTLDLSANTDKFVKDLRKAAGSVDLNFDTKPLIRRFGNAQRDIQKILSATVADAAAAGFSRTNIQGFAKKLEPLKAQIESSMKRTFDLEIKVREAAFKRQDAAAEKAALELEKKKLEELNKRFKLEESSTKRLLGRRIKAAKDAAKIIEKAHLAGVTKAGEAAESFGSGIEASFNDLKSGNIGGIFKRLGKASSTGGKAAAGKATQGGAGAGALAGIGQMLSTIGPALAAIGAIAAGIAAVVAVVVAADSAMKGLNKSLMDAGVSGADLADEFGVLGDTMDRIRNTFAGAFTFNRLWGTTAKDHMEILGAYAGAGVTFREMTVGVRGAAEEMDRLREYTVAALTYSKLLGMSTQEVSTSMSDYMEELGLTLEGVRTRFSNIVMAAKESGFGVKRFFNMVLQATSGMSMYNVRLEEAAGLLIHLGKILGEKMGGDFLQNLMKGFKDEGTQDRIKKTLTTGVGYSLKVLKLDAIKSSEEFTRKLKELGTSNAKAQEGLKEALGKFGVTGDMLNNPETLVKHFATLSNKDKAKLLATAQQSKSPAMVRMIGDLMNKSDAFKGGLGGAQAARSSASGGAALLLQLGEVKRVLGGKRLDQISRTDMTKRMAAEGITGKQGQEFEKLYEVGRRFSGHQEVLKEEQTKIREAAKTDPAKAAEMADAFNLKFGEEFGVLLTDQGDRAKMDRDASGKAILWVGESNRKLNDTFEDLVLHLGEDLTKNEEERVSEDIDLAREIAANTTDMAKILEQGIEWLLSKIYNSVQYIASFFGEEKLTEEEKAAKGLAAGTLADKQRETLLQIREQEKEISNLEREAKRSGTKEPRKREISAKILERQQAVEKLKGRQAVFETARREVGRLTVKEARPFGKDLGEQGMIAAAMAQEGPRKALDTHARAINPKMKVAEHAKSEGEFAEHREGLKVKDQWTPAGKKYQQAFATAKGERTEDEVYASYSQKLLGLPMGIRGTESKSKDQDNWVQATARKMFGNPMQPDQLEPKIPGKGEGLSTKDVLGPDLYIKTAAEKTREEAALDKRHLTEDERQREEAVKKTIEGIKALKEEEEVEKLAALLAEVGVSGGPAQLVHQAKEMRAGRVRGLDLKEEISDPDRPNIKRQRGWIMRSRMRPGMATPAMNAVLNDRIGISEPPVTVPVPGISEPPVTVPVPGAPGDDFLDIYRAGRQISRREFNARDDIMISGQKSDGAVAQAGRHGGNKGGSSVVINSFGNAAEVIRGIQAAVAAGVV